MESGCGPLGEVGIITYHKFLLKFLLLLLILKWSQNNSFVEEVGSVLYLKPFLEFPSLPLFFTFELLLPFLKFLLLFPPQCNQQSFS